ncbi:MAG TPA: type II toxin-antitoxin system ParD family antitoxin [Humisphaera sp.]|nr:type II toxin-antitoxin system ParD family antitoxin [Humisphaera sp.]
MSIFDKVWQMRYRPFMTMNVSLTPHLEDFIRQMVTSGRYQSASEVVRTALRLLEEQERERTVQLEELRRAILTGIDSGPPSPLDIEELLLECRTQYGEPGG